MESIKDVFEKNLSVENFAEYYMEYLANLITKLDFSAIAKLISIFEEAREQGKIIYFVGNGGSAATASHFANDIAINTKVEGKKTFRVVSLTDNSGIITCIGNDYGFDKIFTYQLQDVIQKNDVLVAMSVSGNSENVVAAVEYANSKEAITVGLTGFDGGELKKISKYNIHVKTNPGEYGPVEDVFQILDHFMYTYFTLQAKGKLTH